MYTYIDAQKRKEKKTYFRCPFIGETMTKKKQKKKTKDKKKNTRLHTQRRRRRRRRRRKRENTFRSTLNISSLNRAKGKGDDYRAYAQGGRIDQQASEPTKVLRESSLNGIAGPSDGTVTQSTEQNAAHVSIYYLHFPIIKINTNKSRSREDRKRSFGFDRSEVEEIRLTSTHECGTGHSLTLRAR